MNNIIHIPVRSCALDLSLIKRMALVALVFSGWHAPLQAQDTFTSPSWSFGVAAGGNFNFHRGITQNLNNQLTVPAGFNKGNGLGLFLAPVIEYHKADTRVGFLFQGGYDSRRGNFRQILNPCDCQADLSTNLSYITLEPSLRYAPFKSSFFLFAGPRIAFNRDRNFTYQLGANPAASDQVMPAIAGEFSNVNQNLLSFQVGAGVDIPLQASSGQTKVVLAPFASFHPYYGQNPRSTENWTNTTLRVGIALKLGRGRLIDGATEQQPILPVAPTVAFSVDSPINIPLSRNVSETFPLRQEIFFDRGTTAIPSRYIALDKTQVANFREHLLGAQSPIKDAERADRQMVVYYNLLNILGDRMINNPEATIRLVGYSDSSMSDAIIMASSVKAYLVNVFGISSNRIINEGRESSALRPNGANQVLLKEGERRVAIESAFPVMMSEFKTGSLLTSLQAPKESYLTLTAKGSDKAYYSWTVETTDEKSKVQYFGPYMDETVTISGKAILGERAEGDIIITMIGQTRSGKEIRQEVSVHVVQWTPPTEVANTRFSVIYEYGQSQAIDQYETYLIQVVAEKIPTNAKVILFGYRDEIGEKALAKTLSYARANDVKAILEKALAAKGTGNVTFEVRGQGEANGISPFQNKYPEERAYNRTVVIDILPH